MIERLRAALQHPTSIKVLTTAIVVMLVANLAAIGPVSSRTDDTPSASTPTDDDGSFVGPDGSITPSTGPTVRRRPDGTIIVDPGDVGVDPSLDPIIPPEGIPDFGLRTQGVTDEYVKVGISYNVASCGDAAVLEAMLGPAVAGDMEKSIETYARHINDTGGIGGRDYRPIIVDDGGAGCPEKNIAAAVEMLDEEKVFMAIPGLHVESDYLIDRGLPVFGGRDDPASLDRYGANGLQVEIPTAQTFDAWASFGRYYLDKIAPPQDLDGTPAQPKCLIRIESGAAGDFDTAERILVDKMDKYGIKFKKILVFKDDVSTAQQQSDAIAVAAKDADCEQAWFLAGNPIGLIFFTSAATQHDWFPRWTFTSKVVLSDSELGGRLMDQRQWENAVGLSTRVPPGEHASQGKCKRIYEKYNGNDGQSESASAQIACAVILTTAEMMRRAVRLTGTLTADTLLLGADGIDNDFFFDAHVPMNYKFPDANGPWKTRGFSHYTVVDWSSTSSAYTFPEYPCYYQRFGASKQSGCEDLRRYYKKS